MSEYRHILVPTDFSTYSENAAHRAKHLAEVFGARLTLVHVVDYIPPPYIAVELPAAYGTKENLIGRAETQLADWAAKMRLDNTTQQVSAGSPKGEIARIARESEVDLIVIGTSGLGGIKRLLGSTTNGILHDAPCDILSVQTVTEDT